jgi:hypothetical protein
MREALAVVDHLVFAAPDLDSGIAHIERLLGCRTVPGGRHRRWGTHNALVSLGVGVYVEIIAADPERGGEAAPAVFGLDGLTGPRLVTWAAKETALEKRVRSAAKRGVRLGRILDGRRERPDGSQLVWRLTDPLAVLGDGIAPFLIDWKESPHPADDAPSGGRLCALHAQHPNPAGAAIALEALDLWMRIDSAPEPALIATIRTGTGDVELR